MSAQQPASAVNIEAASHKLDFPDFIHKLLNLTEFPTLTEVNDWVGRLSVTAQDICEHRRFRTGTYSRNTVLSNEFLEVLILCWEPGQCTVIHDHNGSFGVVHVLEGELSETLFVQDEEKVLRRAQENKWQPGATTGADVPDIHRLYNCTDSGQKLVTLHVYCPPLYKLNTYTENSSEIKQIISGEVPKNCQEQ